MKLHERFYMELMVSLDEIKDVVYTPPHPMTVSNVSVYFSLLAAKPPAIM